MADRKFFDIDLSQINPPHSTVDVPDVPGDVQQVVLGDVMNWVITEKVHDYSNNRGDGKISKSTAKSAATGVNPDIIGEITIGYYDEEDEENKKLTLNNFHSRIYGFLTRVKKGDMTPEELATPVSVRVQMNFLGSYLAMNAPGSPHRTKDKIMNPDLKYGKVLGEIFDQVGGGCREFIKSNKWTVLSSIVYNMTQPDPDWVWPEVYGLRTQAGKSANEIAGKTDILDQKQRNDIADAISFWYELCKALHDEVKESGIDVSKITDSAGFFGFVVCDRLQKATGNSSRSFDANQKENVSKILKNLSRMLYICPILCRGDKDQVMHFYGELCEELKKGKPGRKPKKTA